MRAEMVIIIIHSFGDHKMVEQWQQCLLSVHKTGGGRGTSAFGKLKKLSITMQFEIYYICESNASLCTIFYPRTEDRFDFKTTVK